MISVPIIEAMIVAKNTAPHSIPDSLSSVGLTTMIYAIAKNVVTPPIISLPTVVLFCLSLKIFPITLAFLFRFDRAVGFLDIVKRLAR